MNITKPKVICTIIAKNYIAFARTLCDSFLKYHPDGTCYVLIIDDFKGYIDPARENYQIITIDDLSIAGIKQLFFNYSIVELSTAVKPALLKFLFANKGIDRLIYFDPDILITNKLDGLYEKLETNDIILTPHLDKDYPDDDLLPNDAYIMKSGIFNLGFIGLRKCENVFRFLSWWEGKLYKKCTVNHDSGYFLDQRFIDLAISLFENYYIIKDTGYNVAYWNLHSRKIYCVDDEWRCNDGKLYFYHFSGHKPEVPDKISALYPVRVEFNEMPELRKLFSYYDRLLIDNGYDTSRDWPYSYAHKQKSSHRRILPYLVSRVYRFLRKGLQKVIG